MYNRIFHLRQALSLSAPYLGLVLIKMQENHDVALIVIADLIIAVILNAHS